MFSSLWLQTEIRVFYTKQTLKTASSFIWLTFNESQLERKDYDQVTLIVQSLRPAPPAIISRAINNTIVINSDYIQNYSGDVRVEFIGILCHEATHVWQWNGNRKAPAGLINSVADYVRLKAGLAPKEWPKKGSGAVWDEGCAVTAYFLEYCEGLKGGFVAELNGLMKNDYSDDYFHTLLGETVDELWSDYKSQFGN
ncbi:hypothetical protein BT93_K1515 [Corymbia citriodora subsp. variegata]|nr:hypothetical protein BT93_K1515 [Corymbia citriodora subsp. variegata]